MPQSTPVSAPCGSWQSPISSRVVVQRLVRLSEVRFDADQIYWLEGRPAENGRSVVVRGPCTGSPARDVTPPMGTGPDYFNVRTHAHGYGGGAWNACAGLVYSSNYKDGRLYRQAGSGGEATPITPAPQKENFLWSYADGLIDRVRNRWIGVLEDNSDPAKSSPDNRIVAINLGGDGTSAGTTLASGHDFFSSPRLSPDGRHLAWLAWDHPNMPWQGTTLYMMELASDGTPYSPPVAVAGGQNESIFQPEWSPDGSALFYVSDRSGWWNLYRLQLSGGPAQSLAQRAAEFGAAQWSFGMSTYAFVSGNRLACTYSEKGLGRLALIELDSGRLTDLALPFTSFVSVCSDGSNRVAFVGGAPNIFPSIVSLDLESGQHAILKKSSEAADDPEIARCFTRVEPVEFPTEGGKTAFGLFYPPANPDCVPAKGDKPPLIVMCHGGPTGNALSTLNLGIQFWTSRGIAVLDVNYGGSTGFGREFRDRLHLQWGVVDVDDCINGARYLAARGLIDENRTVIEGGSAGGYTTLAALAFRDYFEGGASHFGVSDLEQLTKDTHKFESHYLDWLIGPYPAEKELYRRRSPIHAADRVDKPVLFFQGTQDTIVPPNQTELIVGALRRRGIAVGYFLFDGEGHGFRREENIRTTLDASLHFYSFLVFKTMLPSQGPDRPIGKEVRMSKSDTRTPQRNVMAFGVRNPPRALHAGHDHGGGQDGGYGPPGGGGHGHDHGGGEPHGVINMPHQHAFAMLGTGTLYLSHLTMYHTEEHKYQLVLEGRLPDWAMERYLKERAAHPEDSYFLGNSPSDLFIVPALPARERTAFLCDIFRGIPIKPYYDHWPWDGVTPVIANVPVVIERIVHYRLFAVNMNHPCTLSYLMFGAGNEAHMVNWQTKEPDFDHVLSLAEAPDWLSQTQLKAGVSVDFPNIPRVPPSPPGAVVHCINPLPKGSQQLVRYRGSSHPLPVKVGPTFWFCTKICNANDPCAGGNTPCGTSTPAELVRA